MGYSQTAGTAGNILPKKATFDNYEVEHDFPTIGRRIMLLNARQIQRASGKERIILLAIEDITERKEIEYGLEKPEKNWSQLKNPQMMPWNILKA